ncbi:CUB domain-containing protein 1 [Nematolebias whitei]|uniref:CUB domain-containing protein 1 n=1 Tax=Nematolebias whitei TaxID=451745 RepID=UPI00189B371D|nr:CUB domain-containing protein 1 [Nematolebias whitei]
MFTVSPDPGSTVNISNSEDKSCKVCTGSGSSRQCSTSLVLQHNTPVSVEFDCSKPQEVFTVETVQNIDCSTSSCSNHINLDGSGLQSLLDFNRRFTWNITALHKAFKLDFTKTGLRQISPSETCPDKHTFTLLASRKVLVGKYCRSGSISRAQVLGQGSFSVDIPAGQKLQNDQIDVTVGEKIRTLAKISLTLPNGTSTSELLSPNYPKSFPNDDEMEWAFQVPLYHRAAVEFRGFTQPQCWKKETAVEYHSNTRSALVLSLDEAQPQQYRGSFSMILRNCKMDRSSACGLSLNFTVTVSSLEVLCQVDLSDAKDFSLSINKVRLNSDCLMKMNSVTMRNITVTSSSKLIFTNCFPEDVEVTAKRTVDCSDLKDCLKTEVDLLVPQLPSCLPAPLSSVTWTLRPMQHGTVALTSALRQDLPEQQCNDSITVKITEEDGLTVGDFCFEGAIEKVLVHAVVSVTLKSRTGTEALRNPKPLLKASFETDIPENYIFMVSLSNSSPVFLATPSWPQGMKSSSNVSWIVSVPSKMKANLMFLNLNQPKCSKNHTTINVSRVGSIEEYYSCTEAEKAGSKITISNNFYLNMSNCEPESGHFRALTKITLQKSSSLIIIFSVVAALLIVFIIVLVLVCIIVRKKKEKLNHQVAVYNSGITTFQPGDNDDSHVYTSIEDTLVYSHLLKKGIEMGTYGDVDTYQPFTGPTDSQMPPVCNDDGDDNMEVPLPSRLSSQRGRPLPDRPPLHPAPGGQQDSAPT